MKVTIGRILLIAALLGGASLTVWALLPRPVEVEVASVTRGPMRVTVEEDGVTRIRERYVVSAPLDGRLARMALDPGDPVIAEETVLATIEPTDPALLDARALAESEARVRASEAAVERALTELDRDMTALEFAEHEAARMRDLSEADAASSLELERANYAERFAQQDVRSAEYALQIARFELDLARSALLRAQGASGEAGFIISAPVSGRVLRVFQESVAVVAAGTPLLELGDPADLEAVVDVLSIDAVGIRPGDPVIFERWGGGAPLRGAVRLVEPAAFTKISSLGIEEQRVNVIIDLLSDPAEREGLGHGFRIEAGIIVWQAEDVLVVPESALFRSEGEGWATFVIEDGRAVIRTVEIGRRNGEVAEVLAGLEAAQRVIVHPGDRVGEGSRVLEQR